MAFGAYTTCELVGEGSFGQVFKAKRYFDGEIVAIKAVQKHGRSDEELKSLRQEWEIQRELQHPNIVPIYGCYENKSEIWVETEYVPKDLHKVLRTSKSGHLSVDRTQAITCDLVSALYYLHSKGILHRDIKPQNVLIKQNGQAMLCDFGFARSMKTGTCMLTSIKGTPLYMAPELIEEHPYDYNVDLWSLGCIVFEIVTGAPPFNTNSILHLIRLIRDVQIRWPDCISDNCKSFLQRLLQKDPSRRLTWPALLEHPFVKDKVVIVEEGTVTGSHLLKDDLANDEDESRSNSLSDWNPVTVESNIENEEWIAFLQKSMEEIMDGEMDSLLQQNCVSVFVSPLRNPRASFRVVKYVACLLSLPFVASNCPPKDYLDKIEQVYLDVWVVPNLVFALKLLMSKGSRKPYNRKYKLENLDDNVAIKWNANRFETLEYSILVLCRLIHNQKKFLTQFCDAIYAVNGIEFLKELLKLREERILGNLIAIFNEILRSQPENANLVKRVVLVWDQAEDAAMMLCRLLAATDDITSARCCCLIRLLGGCFRATLEDAWSNVLSVGILSTKMLEDIKPEFSEVSNITLNLK
ncbi:Serine/threonine-protein kinase fused [Dufourea novaeangliae]|uniref:non-specific serine/threonine protein kinase n=1 Tax=Dufourea novaeangliae TaxID=178035 RepID=A0A154PGZ7_DUFNO|nr:Serine/threonine-protein kinase fused [Dufourea novaeangliae]